MKSGTHHKQEDKGSNVVRDKRTNKKTVVRRSCDTQRKCNSACVHLCSVGQFAACSGWDTMQVKPRKEKFSVKQTGDS